MSTNHKSRLRIPNDRRVLEDLARWVGLSQSQLALASKRAALDALLRPPKNKRMVEAMNELKAYRKPPRAIVVLISALFLLCQHPGASG